MNKVSVSNRSFKTIFVPYVLLACWIVLFILAHFLPKGVRDFWNLDISLFWRFAENPDLFCHTSPILGAVFNKHPGVTIDFFKWLVTHGITQQIGYAWLYILLVSLATAFVCIGFYNAFRGMDLDRPQAVLGVMIATTASMFVDYSRLHPLAIVMTHGGGSMFALATALLALGLFLRGYFYPAGLIAAGIILIHAVTGPLISALVFVGAVFSKRYKMRTRSIIYLTGLAGLMVLVSSPFLMKLPSAITGESTADPAVFFYYVNARSSNPMPLRDGLDHVFTHLAVFYSLLVMISYLKVRLPEVAGRLRWAGCFWLICYLLQIIFSDIFHSQEFTRLVLNRVSPFLFFLLAIVVISHLISFFNQGGYFPAACILLISLLADKEFLWVSSLHTYNLGFSALLVALVVHLNHSPQFSHRWINMGFFNLLFMFLLISIIRWLVGVGFSLHTKMITTLLSCLSFLIAWQCMKTLIYWIRKQNFPIFLKLNSISRNSIYILLLLGFITKLSLLFNDIINIRNPDAPSFRLYSRSDVVELIKNNTDKKEVIFSTVPIDLNGVRKQYLDWKYEWYALYQPDMIPDIIRRAGLIGINIENDEHAEKICGDYKWLYRDRCYSNILDANKRILSFPWRSNVGTLVKTEPHLTTILIKTSDIQKDDSIIARTKAFALVRLTENKQ